MSGLSAGVVSEGGLGISTEQIRTGLLIGAAALLGLLLFWEGPKDSIFWAAAFDAGHTFVFAVVALAILRAAEALMAEDRFHRWRHYLVALGLAVLLGGLTELLQAAGNRDAESRDFVRDVLGAGAGLLLAAIFDRKSVSRTKRQLAIHATFIFLLVALLVISLSRVVTVTLAYSKRDSSFPRLCDFDSAWEATFVSPQDALLTLTRPPDPWGRQPGDRAALVTFLPARYPGLVLREPRSDWSGYDQLVFDVYSTEPGAVRVVLRIDDAQHNDEYSDRFNLELTIENGPLQVVVPLRHVKEAPQRRSMNMRAIRSITLFAVSPSEPFSLYFDAFRLENN